MAETGYGWRFLNTALLDYVLYRQYFPLHALGLYEARKRKRSVTGRDKNQLGNHCSTDYEPECSENRWRLAESERKGTQVSPDVTVH